jgi:DNA-binding PadR family transcriptional regulator
MELSKTSYVILGMLKLGRRTGYEIKSLVDVSTRFFWAASYGQIYPELARLEELGLVTGEADSSNGRRRKAYELTRAGERALHAWLTSDEALHIELRHEGALKFFFSDTLDDDEQLALVRRVRDTHARIAAELRAIEPDDARGKPPAPLLTLEFGIAYQEFLADWCARAEQRLAADRKPTSKRR